MNFLKKIFHQYDIDEPSTFQNPQTLIFGTFLKFKKL
jgi:hypothetical protein